VAERDRSKLGSIEIAETCSRAPPEMSDLVPTRTSRFAGSIGCPGEVAELSNTQCAAVTMWRD
jgi:hypothetical protein